VYQTPLSDRAIGQLMVARHVVNGGPVSARSRTIIVLLVSSAALMMTGYGIVMPVLAKRRAEFGSGVADLTYLTMGFALAQFTLSPVMGSVADRVGRRPLVLLAPWRN
jgi:MFS family permease